MPSVGLAPVLMSGYFQIIRKVNDRDIKDLLVEQNENVAVAGHGLRRRPRDGQDRYPAGPEVE